LDGVLSWAAANKAQGRINNNAYSLFMFTVSANLSRFSGEKL
jgi:hypothetical protein